MEASFNTAHEGWSIDQRVAVHAGLCSLILDATQREGKDRDKTLTEKFIASSINTCAALISTSTAESFDEEKFFDKLADITRDDEAVLTIARGRLEEIAAEESAAFQEQSGKFDVSQHLSKDVEEMLINKFAEFKAATDPNNDQEDSDVLDASLSDAHSTVCKYCGLTELELCSPLVLGFTREEHKDYAARNSDAKVPYMPHLDSPNGEALLKAYEEVTGTASIAPVVVHEQCALHM
jgi:hypothetical protein